MTAPSLGGFYISQIHEVSKRVFRNLLLKNGIKLNPNQGRVLFLLWQHDDIPIRVLKDKSGLSKTTLTSVLEGLKEKKYIAREKSPVDGREFIIKNTKKSTDLGKTYSDVSNKMTEYTYKGFKPEEIHLFEEMLNKVLKNLRLAEKNQK